MQKSNPGKALTRAQQKNIMGGIAIAPKACVPNGLPCNAHVQCCSNFCDLTGIGPTDKTCAVS